MTLSSSLLLALSLFACGEEEPADGSGDACETTTWSLDADGDGYGGEATLEACEAPAGYVDNSDDCDDLDASAFPGGTEVCDGADNDCDGAADNEASDALSLYTDADGDGFGGAATTACELTDGLSEVDGDCDDSNADSFPGADEVCDGADNDCDGLVDGHAVPADFATVQEAVDAAEDGDLICLDAGTYEGAVTIDGKGLRLEGQGPGNTVLDGDYAGTVLLDKADGTSLVGLTVTGSTSPNGALVANASSDLLLQEVEVSGNDCDYYNCRGVGIYMWLSDATLVDVDVTDNSAGYSSSYPYNYIYGAVYLYSSNITWLGGSVSDNTMVAGTTHVQTNNSYSYSYSGVYVSSSDFYAQGLEIRDNHSESIGTSSNAYAQSYVYGPFYASTSDVVFEDVDVVGNTNVAYGESTTYGYGYTYGVMAVNSSNFTWDGGELSDNAQDAEGSWYGNTYLMQLSSTNATWTDVEVASNEATTVGGDGGAGCFGIYTNSSYLDWIRVDLRDHELVCSGTSGGMLYGSNTDAWMDNVIVAGNTISAEFAYGPLANSYGEWTLTNSVVHGNETSAESAYGGGITTLYGNSTGSLELLNSAITGNTLDVDSSSSSYPGASTVTVMWGATLTSAYSNLNGNTGNGMGDFYDYYEGVVPGPVGADGNVDVAPGYASTSGSPAGWDLSLSSGSAMIDAGDPGILDVDGSVSDIGAYGGPEAW